MSVGGACESDSIVTLAIRLCYMALLTLRKGDHLGEPDLIRRYLKRDWALPEEGDSAQHEEAWEEPPW